MYKIYGFPFVNMIYPWPILHTELVKILMSSCTIIMKLIILDEEIIDGNIRMVCLKYG